MIQPIRIFSRSFAVIAICLLMTPAAMADVRLTPGHSYGVIAKANQVLLDLAVRTAIDDEWVDMLRDMTADSRTAADRAQVLISLQGVRDRLNRLRAADELPEVSPFAADAADSNATLYVATGKVLDALVQIIYANDNLAMIANYYLPDPTSIDQDLAAIAMQADLLSMRLDAYIEENEL